MEHLLGRIHRVFRLLELAGRDENAELDAIDFVFELLEIPDAEALEEMEVAIFGVSSKRYFT